MADTNPEMNKGITPVTKDVASVKRASQRATTVIQPQVLFHQPKQVISELRPSMSEPIGRKKRHKGDNRTLVETTKGKKVLSSDARCDDPKY